jgi:hypothetical protein
VPSGAQRYFDRFDAIAEFIRKYQAEIEAQVLTDASASTGPEERD